MSLDALKRSVIALAVLGLSLGCDQRDTNDDPQTPPASDAGAGGGAGGAGGAGGEGGVGGGGPGRFESLKSNLRFKGPYRLEQEFSRALQLNISEICNELGLYGCLNEIHTVALGGVEPYVAAVYDEAEQTGATSPMIVDRVALSACVTRLEQDRGDLPNALIWGGDITLNEGRLADVEEPAVVEAITTLYTRILKRRPTEAEVAHHQQLYRDIEASEAGAPARDWAVLSCFAVLTTLESLFY